MTQMYGGRLRTTYWSMTLRNTAKITSGHPLIFRKPYWTSNRVPSAHPRSLVWRILEHTFAAPLKRRYSCILLDYYSCSWVTVADAVGTNTSAVGPTGQRVQWWTQTTSWGSLRSVPVLVFSLNTWVVVCDSLPHSKSFTPLVFCGQCTETQVTLEHTNNESPYQKTLRHISGYSAAHSATL